MLASGKMDRRVTIQRAITAQDATGQVIETWSTLATVWASWRRASANETLAASELASQVTDIFETRYFAAIVDINPKDQVLFNGRTYDIADAVEIGRKIGIRITAAARSDG
jgi:SPP1 family predicted phage head-tail adaptor